MVVPSGVMHTQYSTPPKLTDPLHVQPLGQGLGSPFSRGRAFLRVFLTDRTGTILNIRGSWTWARLVRLAGLRKAISPTANADDATADGIVPGDGMPGKRVLHFEATNGFSVIAHRNPLIAALRSGKNAPRLQFLQSNSSIVFQLAPLTTRATLVDRNSPG